MINDVTAPVKKYINTVFTLGNQTLKILMFSIQAKNQYTQTPKHKLQLNNFSRIFHKDDK